MGRFDGVRERVNSTSRSAWLALGLIVVAGLVAATFTLGDPDELADTDTDNGAEEQQTQDNGEENGTDNGEENGDANGDEASAEDEATEEENGDEEMPTELADTGAALPLAATFLFGGSGYYYFRSRNQVRNAQRE